MKNNNLKNGYIHIQQIPKSKALLPTDDFVNGALDSIPVTLPEIWISQTGDDWHALLEIHDFFFQSWNNFVVTPQRNSESKQLEILFRVIVK